MVTPEPITQATSQEPDRFVYDYDTVRTVGLTLATIMFVLGIVIILSKKVKCRKSDSRSEGSLGGLGMRVDFPISPSSSILLCLPLSLCLSVCISAFVSPFLSVFYVFPSCHLPYLSQVSLCLCLLCPCQSPCLCLSLGLLTVSSHSFLLAVRPLKTPQGEPCNMRRPVQLRCCPHLKDPRG
ncbi:FXYD domain-containing ion transport regulator 7 [Macrotis lagotis]|uniref:FXYD domain-containing ion transport regulator 7 n=1 Tax=Macrotis lagotis TaxID=92651 RepID=UPI003D690D61